MQRSHPARQDAWFFGLTCLLVAMAYVTGGGSVDRGPGDVLTQLLSVPLIVVALWRCMDVALPHRRIAVLAAIAMVVPLLASLQLLPASFVPGGSPPETARILSEAGVPNANLRVSHAPWATERGILALMPALAAFLAGLSLPPARNRQIAMLVPLMVTSSVILGFVQLGLPQDSPLNPFPEWEPALNGVFANPNHQATGVGIALVLLLAAQFGGTSVPRWARLIGGVAAMVLLVSLPLLGSRAMLLIAAGALLLTVALLMPRPRGDDGARPWWWRLALLAGLAVVGLLLLSAGGWIRADLDAETRTLVARQTLALGRDAWPWGIGVGAFVPWFDAHLSAPLAMPEYFNHAHNEYAQWFLESGVLGTGWIVLLIAGLAWSFPRRATRVQPHVGWLATAAWTCVAIALLHSLADYPLRTPALMVVTAWAAGLACALRVDALNGTPASMQRGMAKTA